MSKPKDYKDFFQRVARSRDTSEAEARDMWMTFYEEILTILFVTGRCVLPEIGVITLTEKDEQVQKQVDEDGVEHLYVVPARDYPIFTAEDDFINDINLQGVTRAYRKRLKTNTLTKRDYLRIQRAETLGMSTVERARQQEEVCRVNFSKKLAEKKEKVIEDEKNKQ